MSRVPVNLGKPVIDLNKREVRVPVKVRGSNLRLVFGGRND